MDYESFREEMQDEISNISHEDILEESEETEDILLEESDDILEDSEKESEDILLEESEDILEESEGILEEPEIHTEFPNEAYADLMVLVTQHKLNNKAGNAIIKFFNKHSNLTTSPLPKNIERGREFMNNMTFADLKFKKTCITRYNDNEYFLYHRNLISCIKNILAIPDIAQDFALSFSKYTVLYNFFMIIISCYIWAYVSRKGGKLTFFSKPILLNHFTDFGHVHKIGLITKISKKMSISPFSTDASPYVIFQ